MFNVFFTSCMWKHKLAAKRIVYMIREIIDLTLSRINSLSGFIYRYAR